MTEARVSAVSGEIHAEIIPTSRITNFTPELHFAGVSDGRVSSLSVELHTQGETTFNAMVSTMAVEIHTSIINASSACVTGQYIEVHTSIAENPLDTLPVSPEGKIVEKLEWLNDVLASYGGTDQRILVREQPRRTFAFDMSILDEDERRAFHDTYYRSAAQDLYAPAYPYQVYLKQNAGSADTVLYCNTSRGDIREGDVILLVRRDGLQVLRRVQTVHEDHVAVGLMLGNNFGKGTILVPCYRARVTGIPAFTMSAIRGQTSLAVQLRKSRPAESYPGAEVVLPTLDGFPLFIRRPVNDATAEFNAGVETIDNQTGNPVYYTAWVQRFMSGTRQYLINTLFDWPEMGYYRALFDYCRGQQKAFLTPTYREDLKPVSETIDYLGSMTVEGLDYARNYAGSPTYSRLEIETDAGTARVKVNGVANTGGNTVLSFTDPLPAELMGATVSRVSFLLLVRLGSDTVTLNHESGFTTVEITLRAARE